MEKPILMTEDYWMNTPLSITRYYGSVTYCGCEYKICNKNGITLEELSNPNSKYYVGDRMAIQPGEPADLVKKEWIPIYKKVGREKIIQMIKQNISLAQAKEIAGLKKNESRKRIRNEENHV